MFDYEKDAVLDNIKPDYENWHFPKKPENNNEFKMPKLLEYIEKELKKK